MEIFTSPVPYEKRSNMRTVAAGTREAMCRNIQVKISILNERVYGKTTKYLGPLKKSARTDLAKLHLQENFYKSQPILSKIKIAKG